MKRKLPKLLSLFVFFALVFASVASVASAAMPSIEWMNIYLNGHYVDKETTFSVERGTTLSVKVLFKTSPFIPGPSQNQEVRVKAWIDGYRESIEAETERFDIYADRTYSKTLFLYLPDDMEEGIYTLHVMITSSQEVPGESYKTVTLAVQRSNYKAEILSVDLALPAVVDAGNSLVATAVIKNRGSHKLEDVYVKAEIVELGLVKTMYIGDLYPYDYYDNTERDTKTITFSFNIPSNTESGIYTLKVTAYNPDTSSEASQSFEVRGIKHEEEKVASLNLVATENKKKVKAGESTDFVLVLTNTGDNAVTVQLNAVGLESWASASFDKSIVVLPAGTTQTVTLTLNTEPTALEGSHIFSVQALVNNEVVATQNIIAEVEGTKVKQASSVWLWIIVAILAAIALALLITLIVLLVKRGKEVEEKPEEIYY